jgi:UDP:flavonoid glycosyltransferase YjiC (YdhE family)
MSSSLIESIPATSQATSKTHQKTMRERTRVLVASVPIYGHFEKLRFIAADLVRRGFNVSFLTGSVYRESVEKIGARFLPLHGAADFDGTKVDEVWPERASIPAGPEQLCFDLCNCFIKGMPDQYEDVQSFLGDATKQSDDPVIVLQDAMFMGVLPLILGAPGLRPAALISAGIHPVMLSSIDTAPFNAGLPPDSSPEGRARNIAGNKQFQQMLRGPQELFVQKLEQLGATETSGFFLDLLPTLPDRYLQLCIEELEYPRSDAPKGLRYIGNLPSVVRENPPFPPWWDVIVKHEKPLVVVTQGTVSNDPEDLILPTLQALKDLDVLVVATLVRSDNIDSIDLPANVRTAKFIPFEELFKYTDIVVSNGGYGTIQQALSAGVPLVLAGMTEDKPEANSRTAWTGAAINLATQRPQSVQVRQAVEQILHHPSFRTRALELKAKYAKTDSLGDIAATIDQLAW